MTPNTHCVDVVIPVHNQLEYVQRALTSVFECGEPSDFEVIVIDDCSTDQRVSDLLREYADRGAIRLIVNERNLGFTGSVRVGMKQNPDRDVVLLNSDTEVYSNWLTRLKKICDSHEKVCSVSPFSGHSSISSYPIPFTDNKERLEISSKELDSIAARVNCGLSCEALTTSGFCMYITRASLNDVGQFDAEAFARGYGEETDFCIRARKMGWRHYVATDVFVRHASSPSFGEEKFDLNRRGMKQLYQIHPELLTLLPSSTDGDRLKELRARMDFGRLHEFTKSFAGVEVIVQVAGDEVREPEQSVDGDAVDVCQLVWTVGSDDGCSLSTMPRISLPNIPVLPTDASDLEAALVLMRLPASRPGIGIKGSRHRERAFAWRQRLGRAMTLAQALAELGQRPFEGTARIGEIDRGARSYVGEIPCVGAGPAGQARLKDAFLKLARSFSPDIFFDIGAYKGEVGLTMKSIFPKCAIHSFEAAPQVADELLQSLPSAGVQIHDFAATDYDGEATFYRPTLLSEYYFRDVLIDARLIIQRDVGNTSLRKRSKPGAYATTIVPAARMDTFLRRSNLTGRAAIWIDSEGCSLETLRGFGDALKSVDLIHVEVEGMRFWAGQALVGDTVDFLVARGFEPLLRDAEYGDCQFNCIFVRRELADAAFAQIEQKELETRSAPPAAGDQPRIGVEAPEALDVANIPILIPCFNNATYCDLMLKQLRDHGCRNITFVDNASTSTSMKKWLERASQFATIEVMAENLGPRKSIFTQERLGSLPRWFCVTDPDLLLNPFFPPNWPQALAEVTRKFQAGKVGLGLNISDRALFRKTQFDIGGEMYHIWDWEEQFWNDLVGKTEEGDGLYNAKVDTTFALYDQAFFDDDNFLDGIRIGGRFTAKHLPWYERSIVDHGELEEYRSTQRFSYYHRELRVTGT